MKNKCSTRGCRNKITNKKRHLCRRCYMYWRMKKAKHRPRCSVLGCKLPVWTKGFCNIHAARARRFGDPLKAPGRGVPGKARGIKSLKGEYVCGGYRRIRVVPKDGSKVRWILEHRYVMEKKLGRPLVKGEQVHHKNTNKLDNSPGNLELWVRGHPHGMRVPEATEWAREIIARYG